MIKRLIKKREEVEHTNIVSDSLYLNRDAKTRNDGVDFIKGIGIILVIIGHAHFFTWGHIYIYSFHMPLFALVAGFYVNSKEAFIPFFIKRINRLIIPFVFWSFISWIIYAIIIEIYYTDKIKDHIFHLLYILAGSGQNSTMINNNSVIGNGNVPLWFLAYLFVSSILHYFVLEITLSTSYRVFIVVFIALLGILCSYFNLSLPYNFDSVLFLYPFFFIGSIYLKILYPVFQKFNYKIMILGFLFLHLLASSLNGVVDTVSGVLGNSYLLFYFAAFSASFYFILICFKIKYLPVINYLGKNSIILLFLHMPIQQLLRWCNFEKLLPFREYGIIETILVILFSIPLIKLINIYLPKTIGIQPLLKFENINSRFVKTK